MNYRNFILRCCQFYELFISQILEIIHIALQCYYCNRGLTSDKVDQSDYMQEKITIHISLTNLLFCKQSTHNFFATIATLICNNIPLQVKNMFFASITFSNRPLRKHMLSSAGSKGHFSRL